MQKTNTSDGNPTDLTMAMLGSMEERIVAIETQIHRLIMQVSILQGQRANDGRLIAAHEAVIHKLDHQGYPKIMERLER